MMPDPGQVLNEHWQEILAAITLTNIVGLILILWHNNFSWLMNRNS
jgi:hypothetical protein